MNSIFQKVSARYGIPVESVQDIDQQPVADLIERSRTDPLETPEPTTFPHYPEGAVRVSSFGGDHDDRYVDFLCEFDSRQLVNAEHEQDIKRHPSYAKYLEWAKSGNEPPYISVYETDSGRLQSTNRRRTLAAQELGLRIKGWLGRVNRETGLPLKYGDVRAAIAEAKALFEQERAMAELDFDWTKRTNQTVLTLPFVEGMPSEEKAKEMSRWVRQHSDIYQNALVKMYHATDVSLPIEDQGLKPTSQTRRRSYQSESGFVYLANTPERAKTFGDMGNQGRSTVYEVLVPVRNLLADRDQLSNQRSVGKAIGNSVGESIIYGGGVRVKGKPGM